MELEPVATRSLELGGDADWDSRAGQARGLLAQQSAQWADEGFELDPSVVLQLDARGQATHVTLRLRPPPEPVPPGWEVHGRRMARVRVLQGPHGIPEALAELVAGLEAPRPYARLHGDGAIQLIVPIPGE